MNLVYVDYGATPSYEGCLMPVDQDELSLTRKRFGYILAGANGGDASLPAPGSEALGG